MSNISMNLNDVIQIDLSKYPIKLIFAGIVIIFTIISSFGEKSHAEELNKLPRDRNELTSIKEITMKHSNSLITVELYIDYIFQITLDQHLKFLHLDISNSAENHTLNINSLAKNPLIGKYTILTFQSPINGRVNVSLFRSKTLLKTEIFNINEEKSHSNS